MDFLGNLWLILVKCVLLSNIFFCCALTAALIALGAMCIFTGAAHRIWTTGRIRVIAFERVVFFGTFLLVLYLLIFRGFARNMLVEYGLV
jgi:hypothetical protein